MSAQQRSTCQKKKGKRKHPDKIGGLSYWDFGCCCSNDCCCSTPPLHVAGLSSIWDWAHTDLNELRCAGIISISRQLQAQAAPIGALLDKPSSRPLETLDVVFVSVHCLALPLGCRRLHGLAIIIRQWNELNNHRIINTTSDEVCLFIEMLTDAVIGRASSNPARQSRHHDELGPLNYNLDQIGELDNKPNT